MKVFTLLLLTLSAIFAKAEVNPLFSRDQAILVIQGNDTDATLLYDSMNVSADAVGNFSVKNIFYNATYAQPVFDLVCKKSNLTNQASCTLKFFAPQTWINESNKSVLMGINDRFDAPNISKLFNQTSSNPYRAEVFLSADKKLRIWNTFNSLQDVVSFTITYN